jgi:hypothetical protein
VDSRVVNIYNRRGLAVDEMRLVKNIAIAVVVLIVSSIAGVLVIEGGLRLFFLGTLRLPAVQHHTLLRTPHGVMGWALTPNAEAISRTLDFVQVVKANSKGLRDREHEYEPGPGVFRIVVLGDSYMEAYQVDLEQSLPRLLEKQLENRKVEVINLGVTSYGTGQEYLFLREEGFKYKPNLVLMAFYEENDIRNDSYELERALWGEDETFINRRPYPYWDESRTRLDFKKPDLEKAKKEFEQRRQRLEEQDRLEPFWKKTMTAALVAQVAQGFRQTEKNPLFDMNILYGPFLETFEPGVAIKREFSAEDYGRMWDEAWKKTARILTMTRDLCAERATPFAIFLVPSAIQVEPAYLEKVLALFPDLKFDLQKTDRLATGLAEKEGIPLLNMTPAFREAFQKAKKRLFYQYEDHHWNPAGHRLAAKEVVQWLDERKLVPGKK